VLHTQGLTASNQASTNPTSDAIVELVKTLGYVQIDTLQVVNRAHYLTLWSRLGSYEIEDVDRLLYSDGHRRLYEGWGHAASIISLEDYRFQRWRTDPVVSYNPTFQDWLQKKDNRQLVEQTLERIRLEGAKRVADFEYKGPKKGPWYDWKPSKRALEALFAWGDLMVSDRVNFHRVYDVCERVMPDWVDTTLMDPDAARRLCLEQAAKALGIFEARNLTYYAYMRATPARSLIKDLMEDGLLVEIRGESVDGVKTWLLHRDNLPLLRRAAQGEIQAQRTTFLSPFDSIFWAGNRDQKLWGFKQLLECYKPAEQRIYGYFSIPILYKDRLVGRFDPRMDRKSGVMHLNALYLEPGVEPDDELLFNIVPVMRDFLVWHDAKSLEIEKSDPTSFGEKLIKAL
jgi:uncharacterized protein YcaQ